MTTSSDARLRRGLHTVLIFAWLLLAGVLPGCSGDSHPAPPDGAAPGRWPPEAPRQPQRLAEPLPPGADPLLWWKATFFDSLPPAVWPGTAEAQLARALVKQTNEARADNGLPPVISDDLLHRVASAHAYDQALRDYWSHRTPEGLGSRDRIRAAAGVEVLSGGENSSVLRLLSPYSAEAVVTGWEHHAGHRELLLSPEVTRVGIGVWGYGPGEFIHVVQLLVDY